MLHRTPQIARRCLQGLGADGRQNGEGESVSDARRELERLLCGRSQLANLGGHQVHDVVRDVNPADTSEIELPAAGHVVEPHKPFLVQRLEELRDEERVARGLRQHEVRQGRRPVRVGVQRIGYELRQVQQRQRAQGDLPERRAGGANVA